MLLETAGGLGSDHTSLLFTAPDRILRATSASELLALFDRADAAAREGFHAAGCIDYEAGYALHNLPAKTPSRPLAIFGLYHEPLRFDHHSGIATGPALPIIEAMSGLNMGPLLSPPRLQISREEYGERFAMVKQLLGAGDTYQVNFTTRVEAELRSSALDLYEALIEEQPVDFASIVHFDDRLTLSFSPELFFQVAGGRIATRPMKGTAARGANAEEDTRQSAWLARDDKNHAEHVMIVDLLRNDLGRICEPGSVRVDDLFRIEAYPTLFQMTSTVSGNLSRGIRFRDVIGALFPSGSVTGAPKRRTMEIIRDLEESPRGIYTGAVGYLSPVGDASFSVPIRTLDAGSGRISMGVGGGIVADSTATAEYDECLLKASFLSQAATSPRLIETLLWSQGYPLIDLHLARLARSAAELGFRYDPAEVRAALAVAAAGLQLESRVRLLLSTDGSLEVEAGTVTGARGNLKVRVAARRILSSDPWRRHKTTRRALYEREFARARTDGFDEVIFLNERDEIAEGAISNVFVEIDGRLCTPPLNSGALPGVFRQHLLNTHGNIIETTLRLDDLRTAPLAYLGNAVRGLRTVSSIHLD